AASASGGRLAEVLEHLGLHGAADDAAAHHPGVDDGRVALLAGDQDADQAVVAEAVPQRKGQMDVGRLPTPRVEPRQSATAAPPGRRAGRSPRPREATPGPAPARRDCHRPGPGYRDRGPARRQSRAEWWPCPPSWP